MFFFFLVAITNIDQLIDYKSLAQTGISYHINPKLLSFFNTMGEEGAGYLKGMSL